VVPAVIDRLSRIGLVGRLLVVALVIVVALAVIGPIGAARFGNAAWPAVGVAALVVFFASALGTAVAELARLARQPALATVGATMLRMGVALLACAVVHFSGGALSAGGFVYFVLAFYLLVLPLETALETMRAGTKQLNTKTAA
jgi:hypothetical protein